MCASLGWLGWHRSVTILQHEAMQWHWSPEFQAPTICLSSSPASCGQHIAHILCFTDSSSLTGAHGRSLGPFSREGSNHFLTGITALPAFHDASSSPEPPPLTGSPPPRCPSLLKARLYWRLKLPEANFTRVVGKRKSYQEAGFLLARGRFQDSEPFNIKKCYHQCWSWEADFHDSNPATLNCRSPEWRFLEAM